MQACPMCIAGFHYSCLSTTCSCQMNQHQLAIVLPSPTEPNLSDELLDLSQDRHQSRNSNAGRSLKRDSALKDQQSTGRKRAAKMYPLDRNAPCEWRKLSNCGGGVSPIVGCISGLQEARHHGPDKSVTNNEVGNVHRICHYCHYNWHAKNNEDYDWNSTLVVTHQPRPATESELANSALKEMTYKAKKGKGLKIKD